MPETGLNAAEGFNAYSKEEWRVKVYYWRKKPCGFLSFYMAKCTTILCSLHKPRVFYWRAKGVLLAH